MPSWKPETFSWSLVPSYVGYITKWKVGVNLCKTRNHPHQGRMLVAKGLIMSVRNGISLFMFAHIKFTYGHLSQEMPYNGAQQEPPTDQKETPAAQPSLSTLPH